MRTNVAIDMAWWASVVDRWDAAPAWIEMSDDEVEAKPKSDGDALKNELFKAGLHDIPGVAKDRE